MENQNNKIASLILNNNKIELVESIKILKNNWLILFLENGSDDTDMFDILYDKKHCDSAILWQHALINQKYNIMRHIHRRAEFDIIYDDPSVIVNNLYNQNKLTPMLIMKLLFDTQLYDLVLNGTMFALNYTRKKYDVINLMIKKGYILDCNSIKTIIKDNTQVLFVHLTHCTAYYASYYASYYAYKYNNKELLLKLCDNSCSTKFMIKICLNMDTDTTDLLCSNNKKIKVTIWDELLSVIKSTKFDYIFKIIHCNSIMEYCCDWNNESVDYTKILNIMNLITTPDILKMFANIYYYLITSFENNKIEHTVMNNLNTISMYFVLNTDITIIKDHSNNANTEKFKSVLQYLNQHSNSNTMFNKILDKYNNNQLWTPKKHILFPPKINTFVLNILMILKEYSKIIKQIIPKPLIYIIINKFIF